MSGGGFDCWISIFFSYYPVIASFETQDQWDRSQLEPAASIADRAASA